MSLMPTCKDISNHSSDYLDNNIPWWNMPSYWLHFFMCVHCRRYLAQLKLTINTIGKTQEATPPTIDEKQINDVVKHIQQELKPDDQTK